VPAQVLTFLKKIFYIKDGFYVKDGAPFNAAAAAAYVDDAPEFLRAVDACVRASTAAAAVYGAPAGASVPTRARRRRRRRPPDAGGAPGGLRFVERPDADGDVDRLRDALAGEEVAADAVLRLTAAGIHSPP